MTTPERLDRHNVNPAPLPLGPAMDATVGDLARALGELVPLRAALESPAENAAVRLAQYLQVEAVCRWASEVAELLHHDLSGQAPPGDEDDEDGGHFFTGPVHVWRKEDGSGWAAECTLTDCEWSGESSPFSQALFAEVRLHVNDKHPQEDQDQAARSLGFATAADMLGEEAAPDGEDVA